jgi:hypothetical protein
MPREIDEDLIEATIRRVAESKAKREDSPPPSDGEPVPDVLRERDEADEGPATAEADAPAVDEDAIQATIRRVAEAKAKLASSAPAASEAKAEPDANPTAGVDEDAIEATIRRVAEAKAKQEAPQPAPSEPAATVDVAPASVDEDAIEATIRRVAEEKAAREAASSSGDSSTDSDEGDETAEEPKTLEELRFDDQGSGPRRFSAAAPLGGVARSPWAPLTPSDDGDDGDDSAVQEDAQPAAIDDTRVEPSVVAPLPAASASAHDLAEIHAKLDRILELLEGQAAATAAPFPPEQRPGTGRLVNFGSSPRLGVRDSRAATAEVRDERPLPPPPPPIHAEPKRGLELLPRTYRITVEDKRRGVDLVPLHRALLGMENVKDMSLLSYNNGIAIVALDTSGDIEPDSLRAAVSRAMARDAKVEVHNESTMVVKLAEE